MSLAAIGSWALASTTGPPPTVMFELYRPPSLDTGDGFVALQVVAALTILVLAEQGWSTRRTQRRPAPMAARDDRPLRRTLATVVGAQLTRGASPGRSFCQGRRYAPRSA